MTLAFVRKIYIIHLYMVQKYRANINFFYQQKTLFWQQPKKLEQYSISNEEEDIIIDERNNTDDENKEERNLLYNDDSDNNSNANKNEITINSLIKVIIDQRGFLSQAQNNEIPDIPSLFFCFKNQNFPFSNEELLLLVTCIQNCFKDDLSMKNDRRGYI